MLVHHAQVDLLGRQARGRGEAWETELKKAATTAVTLANTSQVQEDFNMMSQCGPPRTRTRNLEPAELVRVRAVRSGRQSAPPDGASSGVAPLASEFAGYGDQEGDSGGDEGARIQSALMDSLHLLLHKQESSRVHRASGTCNRVLEHRPRSEVSKGSVVKTGDFFLQLFLHVAV